MRGKLQQRCKIGRMICGFFIFCARITFDNKNHADIAE
jgi:hypothetical protein